MNKKIMIVFLSLVFMLMGIQNYLFYKTKNNLENYMKDIMTNEKFGEKMEYDKLECAPSYFRYPKLMITIFISNEIHNIAPYDGICKLTESKIITLIYINEYKDTYKIKNQESRIVF